MHRKDDSFCPWHEHKRYDDNVRRIELIVVYCTVLLVSQVLSEPFTFLIRPVSIYKYT